MGVLQGRLGGVGEGLGVGQGLLGLGLVGVQGVVQLLHQVQGGIGVLGHPVGQAAQLVQVVQQSGSVSPVVLLVL